MVFSSIPAYLDQANWPQQPNYHQAGSSNTNPQLPPPPQPSSFPQQHGAGGAGSIRPGSMADRARMANIPMPEPAQKCPRCESTNTKFCYFNNYSLSQPRHFCKTCRRYWTRGGALRNVPVGGGCRRNKRSKGSSSKSPVSSGDRQTLTASTSAVSSSSTGNPNILGLSPQFPPLRFMAPLHQLSDYGTGGGDVGLNYSGISAPVVASSDMNFQLGSSSFGGGSYLSQIPLLGGLERPSAGLYPFQGGLEASGCYVGEASQVGQRQSGLVTQLASVKMEDNQQLNLSRQFLGIPGNNDQYWSTSAAWTDLSGFNTSSTSNPL